MALAQKAAGVGLASLPPSFPNGFAWKGAVASATGLSPFSVQMWMS